MRACVHEECVSLFHDQEQGPVIPDTLRVESGWQDCRVLLPGVRQEGHVIREGPVHSDYVGVSGHCPGQLSKVPAFMGDTSWPSRPSENSSAANSVPLEPTS